MSKKYIIRIMLLREWKSEPLWEQHLVVPFRD